MLGKIDCGINWRSVAKASTATLLVLLLTLNPIATNKALAARNKNRSSGTESSSSITKVSGKLTEVAPPTVIQELRQSFEENKPQVTIVSPRSNEVLNEDTVSVQFRVQDLQLFKDKNLGLGPHLHVFLDNQPYQAVYDTSKPLVLEKVSPGTHTLRVFASRPWHESFKNEGAYAQTTFHIFTKTQENSPDPNLPLLTYSRPQAAYGAEPIMLDFYLTNAPLHLVAREDKKDDIADWRIRCTVNGSSFILDQWQPIYLKGFKPGKNWVQLEFLDENGLPVKNFSNNTARIITYEPGGTDTLSKLVRGEISAAEARSIVDPNYKPPAPEPLPSPSPSPSPSPLVKTTPEPTVTPAPVVPPVKVVPRTSPSLSPTQEAKPFPVISVPPGSAPKVEEPTTPEVTPVPIAPSKSEAKKPVTPAKSGGTVAPKVEESPKTEIKDEKVDEAKPRTAAQPSAPSPVKNFLKRFRRSESQPESGADPSQPDQSKPVPTSFPKPEPAISPAPEISPPPTRFPVIDVTPKVTESSKPAVDEVPKAVKPSDPSQLKDAAIPKTVEILPKSDRVERPQPVESSKASESRQPIKVAPELEAPKDASPTLVSPKPIPAEPVTPELNTIPDQSVKTSAENAESTVKNVPAAPKIPEAKPQSDLKADITARFNQWRDRLRPPASDKKPASIPPTVQPSSSPIEPSSPVEVTSPRVMTTPKQEPPKVEIPKAAETPKLVETPKEESPQGAVVVPQKPKLPPAEQYYKRFRSPKPASSPTPTPMPPVLSEPASPAPVEIK